MLLVTSYVFYAAWDFRFLSLILLSTVVDFTVGYLLGSKSYPRRQRTVLLLSSLVINLGVLAFFKYYNFFADTLSVTLSGVGWNVRNLDIILPVGISFYTFQTLSYTIDVYRGRLPATKSFVDFALFVAFFPQLVAGPIVRASEFLPQLSNGPRVTVDSVVEGLQIFLRGMLFKLVIADNLAFVVDEVYSAPNLFSPLTVWTGLFAYSVQILADFAGYSDMAIGVGRMIGFKLPRNFDAPYSARSVTEFWQRWHMSLSRWLRDYLYIPLGGNRRGPGRTYVNLIITMLLGGLWHGASWNFVAWGGLHGAALALERRWSNRQQFSKSQWQPDRWSTWLRWGCVFLFVTISWVFFRSPTWATTGVVLSKMLYFNASGLNWMHRPSILVLVAVLVASVCRRVAHLQYPVTPTKSPLTPAWILLHVLVIFYFSPAESDPFIYFQF